MPQTSPPPLSRTFQALSDPTRRTVLERLAHGPATVGTLAAEHAMSLPAFTKHIGVLVDAGLVARRKVGRSVECALRAGPLAEAHAWLDDMAAFWSGSLDRLETLLDPTPADPSTDTLEDR